MDITNEKVDCKIHCVNEDPTDAERRIMSLIIMNPVDKSIIKSIILFLTETLELNVMLDTTKAPNQAIIIPSGEPINRRVPAPRVPAPRVPAPRVPAQPVTMNVVKK